MAQLPDGGWHLLDYYNQAVLELPRGNVCLHPIDDLLAHACPVFTGWWVSHVHRFFLKCISYTETFSTMNSSLRKVNLISSIVCGDDQKLAHIQLKSQRQFGRLGFIFLSSL